MNRRKSLIESLLTLCILCALCCGLLVGCDQNSAQRIAEVKAVIDQANEVNQTIDAQIEQFEVVVQNSQSLLDDPNVPDDMKPQIQKALNIAVAKLSQLKTEKAKVTASLAKWQAILDEAADINDIDLAGEIQTYAAMTSAASAYLPAPYSGYVYLGSTLATVLAGLIASIIKNVKQNQQIKKDKAVFADTVKSVNILLGSDLVNNVEDAKAILKSKQLPETRSEVDAVLEPIKEAAQYAVPSK